MCRLCTYLTLVATVLGPLSTGWAACVAPKNLSAKLQAHQSVANYAQLGTWFSDHGQYECASQAYLTGLKLQPESPQIYYLTGLNFLRKGDTQAAIEALRKSVQLGPKALKTHLLLANAFEQLREPDQARSEWAAALQIDPRSTPGLDGISRNLLDRGDYVSVIQLLGATPEDEALVVDLAEAYQKGGMADQATELLTKAVSSKPASSSLNSALITLLATQARYEEAAKLAKRLVGLRPSDLAAKKLYLHVLVLNSDSELARPLAKKLLSVAPHDFEVLYLNGVLERESGEYLRAQDHLSQAVALNPNFYNCHYNLGFVLVQLKDLKGARKQFEQAIALEATEPEAHFQLAGVLRMLGETKEAAEQLKLYQKEQQAKTDRTLAATKLAQADKEAAGGDLQKALGLYRDAAAAMPENAMIDYKLALVLDRVGDTTSEKAALEKTVQLDPSMAVAHYQLGYVASRTGDTTKAEEQFREAVRAAPAYVEAWISLAATLGMESRLEEAQKAVESALQLDPKNSEALQLRKDLRTASATP